ncbi:MAG TPA: tRNA (adenosine(37)-N6)-dimethylallyltransferase MiaA, partial [Candidatus Saccharimonadales bacterium]|nr:tRNA (adenosine(37)-N6)-dimethylallyltransferase MiaA [Candidatus Saccharimonadales bacterium]
DSVIFDYQLGPPVNLELRLKLQHMEVADLQLLCRNKGIPLPENIKNKRYLMRAIETNGQIFTKKIKPINNCIIVGITTEKETLRTRIGQRTEQLFDDGVVEEAKLLGNSYGWDNEAMKSNIYPLVHDYLVGHMSIDDVKQKIVILDWRLAKRQITWLRRNRFIHWLSLNDANKYLSHELAIHK